MAGCIHLAMERNTQGLQLTDAQRLNFMPASPLPTVTWLFEGSLCLVEGFGPDVGFDLHPEQALTLSPALPPIVISGPHRRPVVSWSPGAIHALTVSFYPDAWSRLLGVRAEDYLDMTVPIDRLPPSAASAALTRIGVADPAPPMQQVEAALRPLWHHANAATGWHDLRGWLRSTALRAAFTKTGTSVRQAQRRFKDWTGQSQRELALFARVEAAFQWSTWDQANTQRLAATAAEAGYADQAHLGREVKRVTGLPPARFTERVRTDEAFWLYRLLSEHLRGPLD